MFKKGICTPPTIYLSVCPKLIKEQKNNRNVLNYVNKKLYSGANQIYETNLTSTCITIRFLITPGLSVAVLQTPLSLDNSLIASPFSSKPSTHDYTQTVRARELKSCENVHPHHVSHFRCHMSGVNRAFTKAYMGSSPVLDKSKSWFICPSTRLVSQGRTGLDGL